VSPLPHSEAETGNVSVTTDRLVIYPSRVKMALVLLGAIALVLVCLWAAKTGFWDAILAACIGVPFFGACGLYAAYRLIRRRPSFEMDSMGIIDTGSAIGVGRVFWEDIDHVYLYMYHRQWLLGIVPRDLEGFLSRQNSFRRSVIQLNLRLGCAPVNVSGVQLPMSVAEFAELLHTRHGVRVKSDA